jgi:hypothetical protein
VLGGFVFTRIDQINPAAPRWSASAKITLAGGKLQVDTEDWGGVTRLEWAGDAERAR